MGRFKYHNLTLTFSHCQDLNYTSTTVFKNKDNVIYSVTQMGDLEVRQESRAFSSSSGPRSLKGLLSGHKAFPSWFCHCDLKIRKFTLNEGLHFIKWYKQLFKEKVQLVHKICANPSLTARGLNISRQGPPEGT